MLHDKAWDVKRFRLDEADRGRRIAPEFDGVYRNCPVPLCRLPAEATDVNLIANHQRTGR